MSIIIHCESCKQKIKAPDAAGGKYGKCPFCRHRNYIPMPKAEEEEELRLAPLEEDEKQQKQKLMLETYTLTQQILGEKKIPEENTRNTPASEPKTGGEVSESQLLNLIVRYLSNMAHSHLDTAQNMLKDITPHKEKANDLLDRLLKAGASEPELSDISPTILRGLINNLKKLLK